MMCSCYSSMMESSLVKLNRGLRFHPSPHFVSSALSSHFIAPHPPFFPSISLSLSLLLNPPWLPSSSPALTVPHPRSPHPNLQHHSCSPDLFSFLARRLTSSLFLFLFFSFEFLILGLWFQSKKDCFFSGIGRGFDVQQIFFFHEWESKLILFLLIGCFWMKVCSFTFQASQLNLGVLVDLSDVFFQRKKRFFMFSSNFFNSF